MTRKRTPRAAPNSRFPYAGEEKGEEKRLGVAI